MLHKPACWNGRRDRLKICCPQGRAGSSPAAGSIKKNMEDGELFSTKASKFLTGFLALVMAAVMAVTADIPAEAAPIANGIDVSKHQSAINWSQVAASGVQFAFIKIGSLNSGVDPQYMANLAGAQAAGIKTGVYIYSYATSVAQAQQEANLVITWLGNNGLSMPVAYDIEDACMRALPTPTIQTMVATFCNTIEAAGYYPVVYSFKNLFLGKIGDSPYDKWVAQYGDGCDCPVSNIAFWQYSSHGAVAGIPTRVDMDYQLKDYSALIVPNGFAPRLGQMMFFANYKMQKGWVAFNGLKYYMNPTTGFLVANQWITDATGTYYLNPGDGHAAIGQTVIAGQNYYFDANGARQTGWVTLPTGIFLYAADTGIQVRGWFNDGKYSYYLNPQTGAMTLGLTTIDKKIYYFDATGHQAVGMTACADGIMRYFNPADNGSMSVGWFSDGKNMYYAAADGHLMTGANTIDKANYMFGTTGALQTGFVAGADGLVRYYNPAANGAMMTGWITDPATGLYYAAADGHIVTGLNQIGPNFYYFNESGVLQVNQSVTVNGVVYVIGADGIALQAPAVTGTGTDSAAAATTTTTTTHHKSSKKSKK